MRFEDESIVNNQGNRMELIRQAAIRFTLCAQELRLTQKEAKLAVSLMERNAHQFLTPDRIDGKATPKQILFLQSKGFQNVQEWPLEAAHDLVDAIAANSWRVPDEIDPDTYKPENKA